MGRPPGTGRPALGGYFIFDQSRPVRSDGAWPTAQGHLPRLSIVQLTGTASRPPPAGASLRDGFASLDPAPARKGIGACEEDGRVGPELAHLVRGPRRTTRPGLMKGFVGRCRDGFPVFSYRGGRYGPAVTGGVQPMLPAAGLPIRLRPGLSRRRSSACAAARPGAPAGHRTRPSGLRPAIASTVSRRGWRRPDRTPKTICTEEARADRAFAIAGGPRMFPSGGGSRHLWATLAQQVLLLLDVLFASARVGASVPRPHATSPEPAALAHAARARCRRGGPVPAPTAAWVTAGAAADTQSSVPEGLVPSSKGQKGQLQLQPGPGVITSHPGIVAQAARACQAPGLPLPGRCRPAGPCPLRARWEESPRVLTVAHG